MVGECFFGLSLLCVLLHGPLLYCMYPYHNLEDEERFLSSGSGI